MYDRVTLDDVEERDVEGIEPGLLAVGYHLRPGKMRQSVWQFDAGESNNWHRQREQEELYVVLDGTFEVTVGSDEGAKNGPGHDPDGDGADGTPETFEIARGDFLVVPPESWRQVTAREPATLLVVGAPNVKDDGVLPGES
ncbi:cupin domain-containing protein [Halobacteriales archaeon QS_1_68_17]|nr:MAG: cupin domain-containing protein [Halobacteriales archaeon QS_1_68_17]